jgi:periplasmic protein TonB
MTKIVMAAALAIVLAVATGVGAEQARDVTTAPVVVKEVKPDYPTAAKSEKQQGTVVLSVTVKADGRVGDVRVDKSLTPKLDAEAVKAAKQWRFKPGTKNGKAVPVETKLEMTFTVR